MDINSYVTVGADGKPVINEEAFKAAFQSEMDRARQQASETAKKNAEKELRTTIAQELEEQAKMTAEEKLQKEREAFRLERQAFDKERIETIYKNAGISDEEIKIFTALIGDNSAQNLETAYKIANARKAANEANIKKLQEEMQQTAPRPDDKNGGGGESSIGAQMAKKFSQPTNTNYVDLSPNAGGEVKL